MAGRLAREDWVLSATTWAGSTTRAKRNSETLPLSAATP